MDFNTQDIKKVSKIADSFKGKSEDEAIRDIVRLIKTGEGGMTPEKFIQMVEMVKPVLNPAQKQKLDRVVRELKKG
ncbi:MAG TPA: hypothetical protein PK830_04470 [Candidatus Atribacteria bacterium]|nr:hypothetical protein [Candidatus Atribacteria bacterium]